jgi:diguanylate cyclase (GGDEF)-like protein/PAS domain S-box-containing protein
MPITRPTATDVSARKRISPTGSGTEGFTADPASLRSPRMDQGLLRHRGRRPGTAAQRWPPSTRLATLAFLCGSIVALTCLGYATWRWLGTHRDAGTLADDPAAWVALAGLLLMGIALALMVRVATLARAEMAERGDLGRLAETLRALLGATSDGVVVVDSDLRIRLFNPAAEILFGRLSEETLEVPIGALIPGLDTPEAAFADAQVDPSSPRVRHLEGIRGGDPFPLRLLLRDLRLDGEPWLLVLAKDQTESERTESRIDYLQRHDPLTGLRNRKDFERAVAMTAMETREAGHPHALCLMDLDHFKLINTACGHGAGDKLLKHVARIIATRFADAKAIGRLGGDEFAALFGGDAAPTAQSRCEDLVGTLRGFPFTWHERSYDVSLSVGLATFVPARGVSDVLAQVDIACQTAKAQGGDRVCLYSEGDAASARHRAEVGLISTIGGALEHGRFRLIAQPIVPLRSVDQPVHYEVLARMRDDQGNPVSPERFIPAAERYILMPAVDRWIVAQLLASEGERLRAWHSRHPKRFLFAVNLSATTLADDGFLSFLEGQFADNRVPYASICFEVTETAAIADLARARSFMQRLRDLGSVFAVDDFGAGFASYAYLKHLPVQYLKIDGSLVRKIESEPVDRALVESINHMGHVLGLATIAEWAETPQVVETLRELGVDYAQGYGVGKPVALDALALDRVFAVT